MLWRCAAEAESMPLAAPRSASLACSGEATDVAAVDEDDAEEDDDVVGATAVAMDCEDGVVEVVWK
jgi:hypothetical protein